jgi:hypothetical protein
LFFGHTCGLQNRVPAVHGHDFHKRRLLKNLPRRVVHEENAALTNIVQPQWKEQIPLALSIAGVFIDWIAGHGIPKPKSFINFIPATALPPAAALKTRTCRSANACS